MSVAASTLEQYTGKQVVLTVVGDDGDAVELTGKVESASEVGMAFKEKGKRDLQLILPDKIEDIDEVPDAPKKMTQKKLQQIDTKGARQHLLDRHGYLRSWANEVTDEQAKAEHDSIDHSDLGHRHLTDEETAKKAEGDKSDES